MLHIVHRIASGHSRTRLLNGRAALTGIGFRRDFHRSRPLSVDDLETEQAAHNSQEQLNEKSNTPSIETRIAAVETTLGSLASAVENLRKSGERAFYFVVGTLGVRTVMRLCVYDNYVERKIKGEIGAVEKRVVSQVEAVGERVVSEIKQTQEDVKKISQTVGEIKGSVDTLIKPMKDRKD